MERLTSRLNTAQATTLFRKRENSLTKNIRESGYGIIGARHKKQMNDNPREH